MQENTTAVTVTVHCEINNHVRCRGQVISMTGNRPCECPCHEPAWWAAA